MIPRQAIEKAIEGGWSGLHMGVEGITVDTHSQIAWGRTKTGLGRHLPLQVIALDPTFWQALGKALGWGELPSEHWEQEVSVWDWKGYARRFYDLIFDDQDVTSFWEELLK